MKLPPFRLLLPVCLASGSLFSPPLSAQEAPGKGESHSLVWRIKGEKSTVYIAGSIHLLHEKDYPLPTPYVEAYEDSARLAFEVPPGDISSEKTAKKMAAAGSYPEGETIRDHVDKETADAADAYIAKVGIPLEQVKNYRPWMYALVISMVETMKHGAHPDFGVDQHFAKRAEKDEKPTAGLETVEDQVSIFSGLDADLQKQMLEKTLLELDGITDQFNGMLKAWKSGDADALRDQIFKEADEFPDLLDALLYKRNANWIDQIVGYIEGEENVMVIVGAGHLVGERSVIDLLEKRGFKAEKLTYAPAKE